MTTQSFARGALYVTAFTVAAAACMLIGSTAAAEKPRGPAPSLDNPIDRDGDGRIGEENVILDRIRHHRERHGELGGIDPERELRGAHWSYQRWLEAERQLPFKGIEGEHWVSLGPNNGAGRFTAVAPHPSAVGTVLGGAAGGGVWRTTDGGATWEPLTDGVPNLSIGAVSYAPSDPSVVYVGTGEGGMGGDFISGIGLLRSEDGGDPDSWILPDEVVATEFYRISVDPRDADLILCATNEGLLRSLDGGATWSNPIPRYPVAGQNRVEVTDVVRSSSNANLLYASLWCDGTCPDGFPRVMRSTDNGVSWSEASGGLPPALANNPDYRAGLMRNRAGLALAQSDDQVLVAAFNTAGSDGGSPPTVIWKTEDGGQTWEEAGSTDPYLGGQGWYDNTITIAPNDTNRLVAGGVYYVISLTGGRTWISKNPYAGGGNLPHVDAHDLQWQGNTLWVACDGGIWKTTDYGFSWEDCNSGLITRQYYGIAIDPVHRERVIGGTQDNGTDRRRDQGDDSWDEVLGGDGFECGINPFVPDIAYASVYYTSVYRSFEGGAAGTFADISPRETAYNFYTPITLRPDTPWVMHTGTARVWSSPDAGDSWIPLSTDVENGSWNSGYIWAIAVTPDDPEVLMVNKSSDVYRSSNGGQTWWKAPRGEGGLTGQRVTNVEISPFDADTAVACMGGHSGARLLRTDDGGITWTSADDGLPEFPVQVARWDPLDPATLYAGTDVGLYRTTDGGQNWQRFGSGLPAVSVHDIRVLGDGTMLRAGTHGRGAWELEIQRPENDPPVVTITTPADDQIVEVGDRLEFVAQASDPDGDPLTALWTFTDSWTTQDGGGATGNLTSNADHTFTVGGQYLAAARVADDAGGTAVASIGISVDDPADDCHDPRTIPAAGPWPISLPMSNGTATRSAGDPNPSCLSASGDNNAGTWGSMWFEFEPEESHTYAISTCGSAADTVLTVWTGAGCGPFTPVAGGCNDDDGEQHCAGQSTDSYVELDLNAGTTYRIMVGSFASWSKGRFMLNVECLDCPPPVADRLVFVPAAAHAEGSNDTYWVTDMQLLNRGEENVEAHLAFLPEGAGNLNVLEESVTIDAHNAVELQDVVDTVLATQGAGAIRVRAAADLLVSSRTFNTAASGTYGQYIPGVAPEQADAPGQTTRLVGLESSADFRTNLGLANTSDSDGTAIIRLFDAGGNLLATRTESLPPFGWKQINNIFAHEGYEDLEDGFAEVENSSAAASLVSYASVVDGRTGDPVYVTEGASAAPGFPVWIAAAAHLAGVGGSTWRTDVELVNDGSAAASVTVEFMEADQDNTTAPSAQVVVAAGSAVRVADVLDTLFARSGKGALRLQVDQGEVMVTSRTFNLTQDGTYGQFIPGAAATQGVTDDEVGILTQLRSDESFRTNVGIANLGDEEIRVRVRYYSAAGQIVANKVYDVAPFSMHQDDGALPADAGIVGGFAEMTAESAGAVFLGYASVVDNGSGDPVFIPAVALGQ